MSESIEHMAREIADKQVDFFDAENNNSVRYAAYCTGLKMAEALQKEWGKVVPRRLSGDSEQMATDIADRIWPLESSPPGYEQFNKLARLAALEMAKAMQPVEQWIPVSERLPEYGANCIAYMDEHQTVIICKYFEDFTLARLDSADHGVTYWMPLPQPPTHDKGSE